MAHNGRGTGKTNSVVELCIEKNWTLLVANKECVKRLQNEFGKDLKCIPWDSTSLIGTSETYLIDHYAVSTMAYSAAERIRKLELKISKIEVALCQTNSIFKKAKP